MAGMETNNQPLRNLKKFISSMKEAAKGSHSTINKLNKKVKEFILMKDNKEKLAFLWWVELKYIITVC